MNDNERKYLLELANAIESSMVDGNITMTIELSEEIVARLRIIAGE